MKPGRQATANTFPVMHDYSASLRKAYLKFDNLLRVLINRRWLASLTSTQRLSLTKNDDERAKVEEIDWTSDFADLVEQVANAFEDWDLAEGMYTSMANHYDQGYRAIFPSPVTSGYARAYVHGVWEGYWTELRGTYDGPHTPDEQIAYNEGIANGERQFTNDQYNARSLEEPPDDEEHSEPATGASPSRPDEAVGVGDESVQPGGDGG